jgi:hypothetical protein
LVDLVNNFVNPPSDGQERVGPSTVVVVHFVYVLQYLHDVLYSADAVYRTSYRTPHEEEAESKHLKAGNPLTH